ncbi:MAG: 3-keto-5-aminohexanoate cleavage protein [Clostridiales Family XIII bacterium]|jgi:uncharacterized protein (DUF849 family)|nr:3-keto-5-aminohexanoate cleavage protein [Clostridiales Family XIII bacterium]
MLDTIRKNSKEKVIITAAVVGAIPSKKDNPNLPTQPKEIAEAVFACYEAGAAVAHIHVRDDNDIGSMSIEKFTETVEIIRGAKCPIILNLTTSGDAKASHDDRVLPFSTLLPEIATFDAGTMNWMHSIVFENSPPFLERLGRTMLEKGVKPEIEVFDMGMLNNAKYYIKKGFLEEPCIFQICLGAPGGMEATVDNLLFVVNHLPENCTWGTFGIGKGANEILLAGLALGGNIRVGFEDNVFYNKGVLAESNAQFVARVGRIAKEVGREVATPDEARAILGLKK